MNMQERIAEKLQRALAPSVLEVRNDSHLHAGHSGSPNTGESHFHIIVDSPALAELSRVQQHRKIYQILAEELAEGIHALSMDIV